LLLYWIGADLEFKSAGNTVDPNPNRINRDAGWHAYGNIHTAFGITNSHADTYLDLDIYSNHNFCYPNDFNSNLYSHSIADVYRYPNTHGNAHKHRNIYANTQRQSLASLHNPALYLSSDHRIQNW